VIKLDNNIIDILKKLKTKNKLTYTAIENESKIGIKKVIEMFKGEHYISVIDFINLMSCFKQEIIMQILDSERQVISFAISDYSPYNFIEIARKNVHLSLDLFKNNFTIWSQGEIYRRSSINEMPINVYVEILIRIGSTLIIEDKAISSKYRMPKTNTFTEELDAFRNKYLKNKHNKHSNTILIQDTTLGAYIQKAISIIEKHNKQINNIIDSEYDKNLDCIHLSVFGYRFKITDQELYQFQQENLTMIKETIGQAIKRLREEKNITIVDLAKSINKSVSYIRKLENDKILIPGQDVVNNIQKCLGEYSLSDIISNIKEKKQHLNEIIKNNPLLLDVIVYIGDKIDKDKLKELHDSNQLQIDISKGSLKIKYDTEDKVKNFQKIKKEFEEICLALEKESEFFGDEVEINTNYIDYHWIENEDDPIESNLHVYSQQKMKNLIQSDFCHKYKKEYRKEEIINQCINKLGVVKYITEYKDYSLVIVESNKTFIYVLYTKNITGIYNIYSELDQ